MSYEQNKLLLESKGYKNIATPEFNYWVKGNISVSVDSLSFSTPYFIAFLQQQEQFKFEVI